MSKSCHFKDLKVFYFHNCVYTKLYTDPVIDPRKSIPTDWVLSNLSSDWKVIFVGDAQMSPHELTGRFYGQSKQENVPQCGMDWLNLLRQQYVHAIWLNPDECPTWGDEWAETYDAIARLFPMFPLTVEGLKEGMKKLLAR
ncbi:MAG: hypothetical protein VB071_15465 [Lawsonibacter sp.]|nr:hypothetical protein [Lawsonibacter sp.]